jgi:hypothetical protein
MAYFIANVAFGSGLPASTKPGIFPSSIAPAVVGVTGLAACPAARYSPRSGEPGFARRGSEIDGLVCTGQHRDFRRIRTQCAGWWSVP